MHDKIAVITRLAYKKDDPKFPWRLETYKKYTLPSLLNQTDDDFDIWVWCKPHHDEIIKALDPRIQVFHGEWIPRENTKYFTSFVKWDELEGLPKYTAQLGLDSDDELAPTAIATIKKSLNGGRKAISLQPIKRELETGKTYEMTSYAEIDRIAPIFCLYQPSEEDWIFAYQYGHYSEMPAQFEVIVYLYGLATMNIHDSNCSTTITTKDKEL